MDELIEHDGEVAAFIAMAADEFLELLEKTRPDDSVSVALLDQIRSAMAEGYSVIVDQHGNVLISAQADDSPTYRVYLPT